MVLIAFSVTMLAVKIASDPFVHGWAIVSQELIMLNFIAIFAMLLFTVFFLVNVAANAKNRKLKVALIIFAMLIATGFIFQIHFQPDDEIVISYFAYHSFLNGTNPYTQNYTSSLLPALAVIRVGPTYTASGAVVGNYAYPALYLLTQIPFFAIFNPTALTIQNWMMPVEYSFFFALLILVYYEICLEYPRTKPVYSAIILAALPFLVFSSILILPMLSLILLMFTKYAKNYSWLILGIMASLQQQLWIIVLLFLAYEFRQNVISGIYSALGVFAVFLFFNAYFIALSPDAFFGAFTSFGNLAPNGVAPLGSLLVWLGAPAIMATLLFIFSVLGLLIINFEKKWIPLVSTLPYLWMMHSLPIYFILGFTAFAILQ